MDQDKYIIRGQAFNQQQIQDMSLQDIIVNNVSNMPRYLYKYYRNIVDKETGENYSLLALENNTVYLQSPDEFDDIYDCSIVFDEQEYSFMRLKYYAHHCGFIISENYHWRYLDVFAHNLYDKILSLQNKGMALNDAVMQTFLIRNNDNNTDLVHSMFALNLRNNLVENWDKESALQFAILYALNKEMEFVRKGLSKQFRVSCFSTSPFMNRMWASQYANNHKGFCIEYEVPEYSNANADIFNNLFPVIYSNNRVSILDECLKYMQDKPDQELLEKIYKYGILLKSIDWIKQDEWRLVSPGNMLADDYNCEFFKISKVYLGNRMSKEDRKQIIDICKRKNIEYAGIIHKKDRFELAECPDLCENCNRLKLYNC